MEARALYSRRAGHRVRLAVLVVMAQCLIAGGVPALGRPLPRLTLASAPSASPAAPGVPGTQARGHQPTEGFSVFSHWTRSASGTVTRQIFLAPEFRRQGSGVVSIDPAVRPRSDPDHAFSAEGTIRPVRFGNSPAGIVELALDGGPVTLSAASLAIRQPEATSDGVIYRDVATDTDLRYRVSSGTVKEELVLHSGSAPHQFTFHIADPAHQLRGGNTQKDGSFRFRGLIDGEVAVSLATPTAYTVSAAPGAAMASPVLDPTSAHMTVTTAGDGVDVTLAVDTTWLRGKAFPIVLDPTVTFSDANATMVAGYDAFNPSGCGGCSSVNTSSADLAAGTYTGNGYDFEPARSFYQFDVSAIPPQSQVTSATLTQYVAGCLGAGTDYFCNQHNYTIELHPLTDAWSSSSTWDQLAALTSSSVIDSLYQPAFNAVNFTETWGNLGAAVQSWVNSPSTNHGFVAKLQSEPFNIGGPYWAYRGVKSALPHPNLQVTYTPWANAPTQSELLGDRNPSELPVTCHTSWGVNCATGNVSSTVLDLSVPGRGVPLAFSRTYNSESDPAQATAFGGRWADNYDMRLVQQIDGSATVFQENGSAAPFSANGSGGYQPTGHVLATLTKNGDGTFTFFRRPDLTSFQFSSGGLLLRETDRNNYATTLSYRTDPSFGPEVATVTDPAGRSLTFGYYASTGPNAAAGMLQSVTDPAGRAVTFKYTNASFYLTDVTDVQGGVTHFSYGDVSDPSHVTGVTDANGNHQTTAYDCQPQTTCQATLGRTFQYTYSPSGTTSITDPNGNVVLAKHAGYILTSLTRGSGTYQAATTTFEHDLVTLGVTSLTDANGHASTTTWDANGDVLSHTDALGRASTYTYNTLGEVLTATDPLHVTSTSVYDGSGNLLSVSRPLAGTTASATTTYTYDPAHPGDIATVTDPDGKVWSYAHDAFGDLTRAVDPLGHAATYTYDGVGRLTSSVRPNGNVAGGSPATYTTTYATNAFGDLTALTDPLHHTTSLAYDGDRNLTSITDANAHVTTYTYDASNELTKVLRADGSALQTAYDSNGNVASQTDALGTLQYAYDPLNRRTTVTDALSRASGYAYDGAGNLASVIDPKGRATSFSYDAANQLLSLTYSDGEPSVTFSYDADGQRLSMGDGTGVTTYTRDSLHRLTRSTNGAGAQVSYGYDLKGQMTSIVYPGNLTVVRGYDDGGHLTSVRDWVGHSSTFAYDADGNLTVQTYPNGTTAAYGYDPADRLAQIVDATGSTAFLSLAYTRDNVGLLTAENSQAAMYDPVDRVSSSSLGRSTGYTYDGADDPTRVAVSGGTTTTFAYDAAHQLTSSSVTVGLTAENDTFTYDALGSRTTQRISGLITTASYSYNQANRLTGALVGASLATYTYNGDGLRTSKSVTGGGAEAFAWDVADALPLLLVDGTTRYVYGPNGHPLEQVTSSGSVLYYHHDQLGSTRALTDASGGVTDTYSYDAYGNLATSTGSSVNPFRYAGEYLDTESGLLYLRARYYDPATAQFLGRDPLLAATRQPYSYAGDSPLNATDPTGLQCAAGTQSQGSGPATVEDGSIAQATEEAASSGTTLFRAVGSDEAEDIAKTGTYRVPPGGVEGKYFSQTQEQAQEFVDRGWATQVTSGEFPQSVIDGSTPIDPLTEGPGYFIPAEHFPWGPVTVR